MKFTSAHISGLGVLIGIVLYELYHKQTKGTW